MTTRPRFRRSPRRGTARKKTSWQQLIFNDIQLLSTGAIVAADLSPAVKRAEPTTHFGDTGTLVRMIAHFDLSQEETETAVQSASIGISVYGHEAQGGPTVNDPNSDPEQSWYYWTSRSLVDRGSALITTASWDVDIRSKRRLRGGQDLLMVMAGRSTNLATLQLNCSLRMLWMLG